MSANSERPVCLLIAALGGEGGGVLTDWIVGAVDEEGYPVQSTSIPGVAQRTGATTYYIEIYPKKWSELDGRRPVLGLYPSPGAVDIMVASELIEAGRAMENGFVTPDRTVLVASTHRVYAMGERTAMADQRYQGDRIVEAAQKLAKKPILSDLNRLADSEGAFPNVIMLGVIAGSGLLPVSADKFEKSIQDRGVAVDSNLRGFRAGLALARGETKELEPARPEPRTWQARSVEGLTEGVEQGFPEEVREVVTEGIKRVADYQDLRYAREYLERLAPILHFDRGAGGGRAYALTRETARYLAVWMSYEDVIRVAELKSRRARFDRVRKTVGAKDHEPVQLTEFFKPGVEEISAILPRWIGGPLFRWTTRRGLNDKLRFSMRVRSHTINGFLRLWTLARLKSMRRVSTRFAEEQALIERWLSAVERAAKRNYDLGLEVVECANLNKGYGDTHARGRGNFVTIMERVVEPALSGPVDPASARTAVLRAREAALADPEGDTLDRTLEQLAADALAASGEAEQVAAQ